MVNLENVKAKYCMDDDVSKHLNTRFHRAAARGEKPSKGNKANYALSTYIAKANSQLGRYVQIYEKGNWDSPNPTFGINWSAIGTVSVPETKAFIQKLQKAVEFIQKAPKASGDKRNLY